MGNKVSAARAKKGFSQARGVARKVVETKNLPSGSGNENTGPARSLLVSTVADVPSLSKGGYRAFNAGPGAKKEASFTSFEAERRYAFKNVPPRKGTYNG